LRPILLIAANFVREQRWPLITLLLYVVVFGVGMAVAGGQSSEDTLFMLRSTSVYGLAFAALMAASALHNERRSRRILAVLSKGIERGQYIAGLLAGVTLASAVYCGTVIGVGVLATNSVGQIGYFGLLLIVLYLYAATVALTFSTLFHPLFAAACAGLCLAAEAAVARQLGGMWNAALPPWTLVDRAVNFGAPGWTMPWPACAAAVCHAVLFWALATAIFARRDIAVAVE
jgi:ABC-type transport system involved in multi-copper enzyme maturation permease subunit